MSCRLFKAALNPLVHQNFGRNFFYRKMCGIDETDIFPCKQVFHLTHFVLTLRVT